MTAWITQKYCRVVSGYKARSTYPEGLTIDLTELISKPRPTKVAIIDNEKFPWIEALQNRQCEVNYFSDYTKPIKQANQKVKAISFAFSDIIICDIHGVGSAIYPELDGIGVMEELRRKHPLHVIAAYTGNPGAIYSKMKKKDTLDAVFSRDWEIDDFLFNFDELLKIFRSPKNRWEFIRRRLSHLEVGEKRIAEIQKAFVEKVLMSQMLKERFSCSAEETKRILTSSPSNISPITLAKFGIGTAEFASLISPFLS